MLGLSAEILKIKWPQDGDAPHLSNFETVARKLRYQALGRACLKYNLQSLLVAHHEDDQAETVMMRMAEGHRGSGLKGMLPVSDIPECWAIHGVHQSGAGEAAERIIKELKRRGIPQRAYGECLQPDIRGKQSPPWKIEAGGPPWRIEDGGVKVYRPFLSFEKERLKATCRASRINWVEDETNQNAALTPRNAVRKLLQLEGLPKAIQKASLLALARHIHTKHMAQMTHVERQFRLCMIDTRVGAAIVRLSRMSVDRSRVPAIYLPQVLLRKEHQCALMVRRIMEMVTPGHVISLEDVYPAAKALFPERFDPISKEQTCKFTCGGVKFERIRSEVQKTQSSSLDPDFVWMLTRQPFVSDRPSPSLSFPRVTEFKEYSTFSLWDGRFWFRIVNRHSKPVVVRPFYPADLALLRVTLSNRQSRALDEFLRIVVPAKIRWTLPVIAEAEEDSQEIGEDCQKAVEGSREAEGKSKEAIEDSHEAVEENDNYEAEEEVAHWQNLEDHQKAELNYNPIESPHNTASSKEAEPNETKTASEPKAETETESTDTKSKAKKAYPKFTERTGGRVLALPTLNRDFGAKELGIKWQVRYKKVNISNHKNFETIIL